MAADFDADAAARELVTTRVTETRMVRVRVGPWFVRECCDAEDAESFAAKLRHEIARAMRRVEIEAREAGRCEGERAAHTSDAALVEREQRAHAAQAQQLAAHPRAVEYQARAEALGAVAAMLRAEVGRG